MQPATTATKLASALTHTHQATFCHDKYHHIAHHRLTTAQDEVCDYQGIDVEDLPVIDAVIGVADDGLGGLGGLQLSFFIQDHPHSTVFDTPNTTPTATRSDYLWERDCIELFFGQSGSTAYTEINAAPTGQFAVYAFDDYRTPNTMPPLASTAFSFDWQIAQCLRIDGGQFYQYSFVIRPTDTKRQTAAIDRYQLTAIIYLTNQDGEQSPIYYAIRHQSSPDFHAASMWTAI